VNNLYLCSFASQDLKVSTSRFIKQSQEMEFYKDIKVFGWNELSSNKKKQIEIFFKKNNKRLFGYACWKPEIILKYMDTVPKESIIQYSDIGCHLNKNGKKRLKEYVNMASKHNILAFKYIKPNLKTEKKLKFQIYFENEYTKNDMFEHFEIPKNSSIRNSEQVWSGTMFIKNNKETKEFLKKWLNVCNLSNLIDDSLSIKKDCQEFVEHRHDQSAFSILCKLNNVFCLSASECEWAEDEKGRFWDHLKDYPILAKRDKKLNFLKRFFFRQLKNIKRIINK
jgi:hypothetical protein|tara:strand:+ start:135 stop:977 length:843 start_codon:yes stop_codon:yes gene_type:complete